VGDEAGAEAVVGEIRNRYNMSVRMTFETRINKNRIKIDVNRLLSYVGMYYRGR
jgi:hypothetical protein